LKNQFIFKLCQLKNKLKYLSYVLVESITMDYNTMKTWIVEHFTVVLLVSALFVHYLSAHFYTNHCAQWGVWGFVSLLWRMESIQCRASKWLFDYSYNYLHHLWIFVGGACVTWIMKWFNIPTIGKEQVIQGK
jgi:hypothetical protein